MTLLDVARDSQLHRGQLPEPVVQWDQADQEDRRKQQAKEAKDQPLQGQLDGIPLLLVGLRQVSKISEEPRIAVPP